MSRDENSIGKNIKRIREAARMKHWVEGKEGEADGKNKDNKKTPRRISENDEKGHSSFRV